MSIKEIIDEFFLNQEKSEMEFLKEILEEEQFFDCCKERYELWKLILEPDSSVGEKQDESNDEDNQIVEQGVLIVPCSEETNQYVAELMHLRKMNEMDRLRYGKKEKEKGKEEGRIEVLIDLVREDIISVKVAAAQSQMTVIEFVRKMLDQD